METLSEPGYFHPHVLLRYVAEPFETYLRAAEYFYGERPERGRITPVVRRLFKPPRTVDPDEEYRLAICLLAEQHELFHCHQFVSTTVGMAIFVLDAMCADIERKFVRDVQRHVAPDHRGQATSLPYLLSRYPDLPPAIASFRSQRQLLRDFFAVFESPKLNAAQAAQRWNAAADLLDTTATHPDDKLTYARVAHAPTYQPANPERVTLRALFECSARCRDFMILKEWTLQEHVKARISRRLTTGTEYIALFPLVSDLVPIQVLPLALSRLCGLALQAPMLSIHLDSHALAGVEWADLAPTWRFAQILQYLRRSGESAENILWDPDLPDRVSGALGWPTVSKLLEKPVAVPLFRGLDALTRFAMDQHQEFCKVAASHPLRPVWLPDMLMHIRSPQEFDITPFYPPFHFAADQIVTHPTCKDPLAMLEILVVYATSTAAVEFLDDHLMELPRTHQILDSCRRWLERRDPAVRTRFLEELVPLSFESLLGFRPSGY